MSPRPAGLPRRLRACLRAQSRPAWGKQQLAPRLLLLPALQLPPLPPPLAALAGNSFCLFTRGEPPRTSALWPSVLPGAPKALGVVPLILGRSECLFRVCLPAGKDRMKDSLEGCTARWIPQGDERSVLAGPQLKLPWLLNPSASAVSHPQLLGGVWFKCRGETAARKAPWRGKRVDPCLLDWLVEARLGMLGFVRVCLGPGCS